MSGGGRGGRDVPPEAAAAPSTPPAGNGSPGRPAPAAQRPGLVVVKLGGTTIEDDGDDRRAPPSRGGREGGGTGIEHPADPGRRSLLAQVAALAAQRPVVVVHGGGKRLSAWLDRLGVPTRFEDGLRVTDEPSLEVTAAVLRGAVNVELVAALRELGCDAVGISGVDGGTLTGERLPGKGRVVNPARVRPELVRALLAAGMVPVVAPLALDPDGAVCNANADDAAAVLARGLSADRLLLLTDVDGIRNASGRRMPRIDAGEAERLIAAGVIDGGMVPKVRAALRALEGGGAPASIIDGGRPEVLARALAGTGAGTFIGPAPGRLRCR